MSTAYLLYFIVLLYSIQIVPSLSLATTSCTSNSDCGSNGKCSLTTNTCNCTTSGYVTVQSSQPCAYEQKKKLNAFLLSFFIGCFGADWFYLAAGSGGYITAGVFKLLTLGGFGVWALADWIRILTDNFPDGQGVALQGW
ncbi:unnamed protein product [Adineta ricciae]|uniref:TM2 domain-containing protein n=1 Tax=Adineta ricciae TaxID=249248 RepID=A0A814FBL4_ADIRI|nr:unnamed protein product [Adineta ricciae]CAF1530749.1 unnamed protein product [Adineta ricciae]